MPPWVPPSIRGPGERHTHLPTLDIPSCGGWQTCAEVWLAALLLPPLGVLKENLQSPIVPPKEQENARLLRRSVYLALPTEVPGPEGCKEQPRFSSTLLSTYREPGAPVGGGEEGLKAKLNMKHGRRSPSGEKMDTQVGISMLWKRKLPLSPAQCPGISTRMYPPALHPTQGSLAPLPLFSVIFSVSYSYGFFPLEWFSSLEKKKKNL